MGIGKPKAFDCPRCLDLSPQIDRAVLVLQKPRRVALERLEEPSAQDGPGSDRARTSGDWVKVLAKDEVAASAAPAITIHAVQHSARLALR